MLNIEQPPAVEVNQETRKELPKVRTRIFFILFYISKLNKTKPPDSTMKGCCIISCIWDRCFNARMPSPSHDDVLVRAFSSVDNEFVSKETGVYCRLYPQTYPPHIGIGAPEDSLQSCYGLVPKPPHKDVIKYNLNANKVSA